MRAESKNRGAYKLGWKSVFLVMAFFFLMVGCRSRQAAGAPSIEFKKVPPASDGGPTQMEEIEGRVIGGRPEQKIVLFARSEVWWVQPLASKPKTDIEADGSWKNRIHLGTEYA